MDPNTIINKVREIRDFYRENAGKDENSKEIDLAIAVGAEIVLSDLADMLDVRLGVGYGILD